MAIFVDTGKADADVVFIPCSSTSGANNNFSAIQASMKSSKVRPSKYAEISMKMNVPLVGVGTPKISATAAPASA